MLRIHHFQRPLASRFGRQQKDGAEALGRQLNCPVGIFVRSARGELIALFAGELEGLVEAVLQFFKLAVRFGNQLPCLVKNSGSVLHLALLIN